MSEVNAAGMEADSASRPAGSLLDAGQVAEIIGMRREFVYELCRRGQIPHVTFGRTRRFRAAAIEGWLKERERGC